MPLTQITGEGVGTTSTTATLAVGNTTITGAATYTTSIKSTTALATPSALTATQATAFASTVSGAAIMGFGTTNDVSLMNRAGTVVLGIGPNTTTVNMTGLLSVTGFGTSSFSAGGTGGNRLQIKNTNAGTGNFAGIDLFNDSGNLVEFWAHSSTYTTSGPNVANGVVVNAKGAGGLSISAENASGAIRFYSGGSTERARFAAVGGALQIGCTHDDPSSSGSPGCTIASTYFSGNRASNPVANFGRITTVGSVVAIVYNAVTRGSISTDGTNTAYNTSSDMRLKRDHGLVTDVSILRLTKIHDYEWISNNASGRGVFAQEAVEICPRAVLIGDDVVNDNGELLQPWSVDYSKYVPDLIVGWQQHDATIATLTTQNTALEARIATLEAQLAQ